MTAPNPNRPNRAAGGQFAKGCPGGPGRKCGDDAVKMARALALAIRQEISPAELRQMIRVVFDKALSGDIQAARLMMDRIGGPPQPSALIEEVAAIRQELESQKAGSNGPT